MKIDSKYIKACLSAYFRFTRGTSCLATEVGKYNSDFTVIMDGNMWELEIKTSKADLNADFKKNKHIIYETKKHDNWCPHFFYFAVPEDLVEYAVSKCLDKPYGVMAINSNSKLPFMKRVKVIKRAKRIHEFELDKRVYTTIYSRLASEMTNLRIAMCR